MVKRKLRCRCIFPRYKWCGPDCSGPGEPINDVDECCKSHDKCLEKYDHCKCDRELMNCVRSKANLYSKKGIVASIIYISMKFQSFFACFFSKA